MVATKSALCAGGMTQHLCKWGFSVFLSGSDGPFHKRSSRRRGVQRVCPLIISRSTWPGLPMVGGTVRRSSGLLWRHRGDAGATVSPGDCGPVQPPDPAQQNVAGRCVLYSRDNGKVIRQFLGGAHRFFRPFHFYSAGSDNIFPEPLNGAWGKLTPELASLGLERWSSRP
jgi:hypothetical protein